MSQKLIHTIELNQLHKLLSHKKKIIEIAEITQAISKIAEIDPIFFALTKAKQVLDPNYINNFLGEQTVHGKKLKKKIEKKLKPRAIKNEEHNLAWARSGARLRWSLRIFQNQTYL